MGEIYFQGWNTEKDFEKSRNYYENIVTKTSCLSEKSLVFKRLGDIDYFGFGVVKNIDRAEVYYKKAVQCQQDPYAHLAQIQLAQLYFERKEYVKAFHYFEQAKVHKKVSVQAWKGLGDIYLFGSVDDKDSKKAITCYQTALDLLKDSDDVNARAWIWLRLGDLHYQSSSPNDKLRGLLYYEKAFSQTDNIQAQAEAQKKHGLLLCRAAALFGKNYYLFIRWSLYTCTKSSGRMSLVIGKRSKQQLRRQKSHI